MTSQRGDPRSKRKKSVSLHGLSFEEAVSGLLRVKPPAKLKKNPAKRKRDKTSNA